jgi:hypothetical protein
LVAGIAEGALRNKFATAVIDRFVGIAYDMQDDGIISRILMVAMAIPVGSMNMNLDIPYPLAVADTDARMAIVGSGIAVMLAYGENFYGPAVGGLLRESRPQAMFPYVV